MKSVLLILIAAGGVFTSGCSSAKHESQANRAQPKSPVKSASRPLELTSEQRAEAFARFAAGISHEINDQSDLALQEFYLASMADPSNEALALDLSRRLLQKKQPEKAIEVLTKASALPQASGTIFSWLARSYVAAGQTNQAIHASRSSIKKSPQLISSYQTLADIYLKAGQTNEVVKLLNSAARPTNSDAIFLINLGELYVRAIPHPTTGEDSIEKRGIEVLDRAVELKPSNPNVRQKLADTYAQLGETKKAAGIYVQLLEEFHDVELMRSALREKLANLYLRSRDKAKAAEQLEAVVRDTPTRYPEAWYFLGAFAYDAKDYEKAAEHFSRALVVNPDFEKAYYELAITQVNLDQSGEALKTLEQARARFPNSFDVEYFTGLAFARLKNYAEALKHYSAAEMIGETSQSKRLNHFFYFQIGTTYERNRDYVQAEKYLEKCIALSPDFAEALNYLGYMWADRGEKLEKALEYIETAVKLEPDNAAYIDSLGWVLFKLNRPEQALENLLKAIQLSEEPDPTLYDHVGDVYRALNQNDKAREAWQKSLSLEPNDAVQKKLQTNSTL